MFFFTAALFFLCGVLLLAKARRMPRDQGLAAVVALSAVVMLALGARLAFFALQPIFQNHF